jgi:hypothetical protein
LTLIRIGWNKLLFEETGRSVTVRSDLNIRSVAKQSCLPRFGQASRKIAARSDQERSGATSKIADLEIQNLIGRP